ncbi:MAG: hypothetical protein IT581_21405 [Verrucomicrobiales bacterium]|nr:hypothetical protein [Verrucomicrobiales bacterium]
MSVNWRILVCRRHQQDLSLIATGLIADSEAPAAVRHLSSCPACQKKVAEWRSLARLGIQTGATDPMLRPSPSLRQRWTQTIMDDATRESSTAVRVDAPAPWTLGMLLRQPAGLLALAWMLVAFFWFSAPRISKAPTAGNPLTWQQIIAVLQPPPQLANPAPQPIETPTPQTNAPSPGPLGLRHHDPAATHERPSLWPSPAGRGDWGVPRREGQLTFSLPPGEGQGEGRGRFMASKLEGRFAEPHQRRTT